MEYESQEHYEAEMGYAAQAEADALAQEAESIMEQEKTWHDIAQEEAENKLSDLG